MQERQLFEYAVVRVVPHVEREEFLNVGVVLLCSGQKFLRARFDWNESRLSGFCQKTDFSELKGYVDSFEKICKGGKEAGPIGQLGITERFRWLTAARSTVLQTSKVHPGLCVNAEETLDRLFEELVKLPEA
ncbi:MULTISPECIES: DUF3037 domain-containing protein [unclassified Imperialibacter]|uniref:DUF3037 domain-containing protein n=1 Tax=unclassified Imperialibacter TaxID=2629706 RepID=UPI00125A5A6B|nr:MULTISPECIES: DUF3037 domain-containing protein [unclassified Imperialibacter]CAD5266343.1 conserved hypothetical protein [Imperialibacter sp. 75]CAD5292192.1 conserved hypothetical protein [Imperialibacter sp. 89]VVT17924.1 conserved hypothetical protein [Imperialibacter sp. EC-SDR9]